MGHIYALLIGINAYPVKPLGGCLNDVRLVQQCLQDLYGAQGITFRLLTDETEQQPTRANIIKAFDFFETAGEGDTCLFYYCGHGSFSVAPPEFPDSNGMLQSLVAIDSRLPGGRDLMDKELAFLIWRATLDKPGMRFIAITDCCHSGTLTKAPDDGGGVLERMLSAAPVFRPLRPEEFLGYEVEVGGRRAYHPGSDGVSVVMEQGPHWHLSAARDNQTAKELLVDGVRHGAFTALLVKALYRSRGQLTYRALVEELQVAVGNLVREQQPGLALNGALPSRADEQYLFTDVAGWDGSFLVYYDQTYGWCLRGGALQNIAVGDVVGLKDGATAKVVAAPAIGFAQLEMPAGYEDRNGILSGHVRRHAGRAARLYVDLGLEAGAAARLRAGLEGNKSGKLVFSETGGDLVAKPAPGGYTMLCRPGNDLPLFKAVLINDTASALYFLEEAEKVVSWQQLLALKGSPVPLSSDDYAIVVFSEDPAGQFVPLEAVENNYRIFYREIAGEWPDPLVKIRITNRVSVPLWLCSAFLGFDFGIGTDYFEELEIKAGGSIWLGIRGRPDLDGVFTLGIDPAFAALGYTSVKEYIKLFLSREKLSLGGLAQDGVELPPAREPKAPGIPLKALGSPWVALNLGFVITRPDGAVKLESDEPGRLGKIRIAVPEGFRATADLRSSAWLSRSADGMPAPHQAFHNSGIEPFDLSAGSRDTTVMDILELTEVEGAGLISRESPLQIAAGGADEAALLPFGYDAETGLYYPLGFSSADGTIQIEMLPVATAADEAISFRSLGGSIRIYFQKVIAQALGRPFSHPRLAVVTVRDDLVVNYEEDPAIVRRRVAAAAKILLFIHGIIGDTASIVPCIKTVHDSRSSLEKDCDLVLAFDYENLNTTIGQNAAMFKARLEQAGLTEGHGKELVIVAHSMGGLVSRLMIEKCDGAPLVSKLVMLGTPNNGTPWADVRDMAGALLTFAINGAAMLKPWLRVLSVAGRLLQGVQVTLKEMDAQTGIYAGLNDGVDPGVPYRIVAGNTTLIIARYQATAGLLTRLMQRLQQRGLYAALDALLFHLPNDIAVADQSILNIPGSEQWSEPLVVSETDCDHLNYFLQPEVLTVIAEAIA